VRACVRAEAMSSAVDAISCSKGIAAPPTEEATKERVAVVGKNGGVEHGGDAATMNGKQCGEAPHCRKESNEEEEDDEEKAPKAIDLGPRVSIKDQLEKDKVPLLIPAIARILASTRHFIQRIQFFMRFCVFLLNCRTTRA
jgi:hypothetical protein